MSLASGIRNACNVILRPFDVELLRLSRLSNDPWSRLSLLTDVATVIDVGVGDAGSPFLYRHFPRARFISVDPLTECRDVVLKLVPRTCKSNDFYAVALGSHETMTSLKVARKLSRSSLLERSWLPEESFETSQVRQVPMRRLDKVLANHELERKCLLKVDTEGFELPVLEGSESLLPQIDYLLLELPTTKNFEDSYTLADACTWLEQQGFASFFVVQTEMMFMNVCFYRPDTAVGASLAACE